MRDRIRPREGRDPPLRGRRLPDGRAGGRAPHPAHQAKRPGQEPDVQGPRSRQPRRRPADGGAHPGALLRGGEAGRQGAQGQQGIPEGHRRHPGGRGARLQPVEGRAPGGHRRSEGARLPGRVAVPELPLSRCRRSIRRPMTTSSPRRAASGGS